MKIEIKHRVTGEVLFSHEQENNSVKTTVEQAVIQNAYLSGADLRNAYLSGAYLRNAYLSGAYLSGAYLNGAYLRGADLRDTDLRDADLRGACLSGADLSGADLRNADLRGADLRNADLRNADLRNAKNIPFIPIACPSDGEFIGWKKVGEMLVKLRIPADARRCSAATNKCRCEFAIVEEITDLNGKNPIRQVINNNYRTTMYCVGKKVFPDSFDENRWNECSHGIHFFINKQEAINY